MTFSHSEEARNMESGRVRQKTRTRLALIRAASELIREGKPPSMTEAAEAALVSPATAYRYFRNAQMLWEEASMELTLPWGLDLVEDAGDDPMARLDAVIRSIGWHMLDEEMLYRSLARASLERWFEQAHLPEDERVPVRVGRRMQWITKALEPLRGQLPAPVMDQLTSALALVWGTEAMITLRDVTRLDVDDAKAVMLTAARWMLRGALLEQDDNPTPSRSTRQPRPRTRRRSQN